MVKENINLSLDKIYGINTLRRYSPWFFYLAVNKLITDKVQNVFI